MGVGLFSSVSSAQQTTNLPRHALSADHFHSHVGGRDLEQHNTQATTAANMNNGDRTAGVHLTSLYRGAASTLDPPTEISAQTALGAKGSPAASRPACVLKRQWKGTR